MLLTAVNPKLPSLESLPSFCTGCGWTARNSNVQIRASWVFRALTLVDARGVCRHQGVELAKAIGDRAPVEADT